MYVDTERAGVLVQSVANPAIDVFESLITLSYGILSVSHCHAVVVFFKSGYVTNVGLFFSISLNFRYGDDVCVIDKKHDTQTHFVCSCSVTLTLTR